MSDASGRRVVVVDGSNLATEGRTTPSLRQLDEAVKAYALEDPDAEIVVVVDASFEHRIDPSERQELVDAELHGELVSPPAGAIGRGDAFVLRIAERTGARVLSNDSFQEFHAEHPWLFDEGRLVGGKPVPGVGWIFTPRIPVRGPKSRQVTGKKKRGGTETLSPPVKAAELARAAKKVAARKLPAALPDGSSPKVGDVWPVGRPSAVYDRAATPSDRSGAAPDGGPAHEEVAEGAAEQVAKKAGTKKAAPKKAAAKKAAPRKAAAEKPAAKKAAAEEPAAKKAAGKKTAPEKAAAKKTRPQEALAKKAPAKKTAVKKAVGKKAAQAAGAQGAGEEAAPAEPAPSIAVAKKAAPTKAAAKKATTATRRKAAPAAEGAAAVREAEEAAPRKRTAKKAAAKKAAPTPAAGTRAGGVTKKAAAAKKAAATDRASLVSEVLSQERAAPSKRSSARGKKSAAPAPRAASRTAAREDPVVKEAIDQAVAEALTPAPTVAEEMAGGAARGGGGKADGKAGASREGKGKGALKGREERKEDKRSRHRRATTALPAVNEPLAFINFVAAYPLQSEIEGQVVSFTSHGAMVDVELPGGGQLHCYIPLTAMGDPPPTKARQVLTKGERRPFLLVGLDPPRRVAELALPGVLVP